MDTKSEMRIALAVMEQIQTRLNKHHADLIGNPGRPPLWVEKHDASMMLLGMYFGAQMAHTIALCLLDLNTNALDDEKTRRAYVDALAMCHALFEMLDNVKRGDGRGLVGWGDSEADIQQTLDLLEMNTDCQCPKCSALRSKMARA